MEISLNVELDMLLAEIQKGINDADSGNTSDAFEFLETFQKSG